MIHGLSSSSFLWEPLIDELGKNYNYYALDLRGHGLSDKPDQGYELSTLQKDINLFIRFSIKFSNVKFSSLSLISKEFFNCFSTSNLVIFSLDDDSDNLSIKFFNSWIFPGQL